MDELRHDLALAAAYGIVEALPASAFLSETQASIAFDIYHRIKAALEAYDAQIGMWQQQKMEPSPN